MASTSGVNVAARPVVGDGLLNVKKAAGWTSHDVVAKLRNLLRGPRVGHAGTLDPAATGVLPVLIGRGIREEWYTDEKLQKDLRFLREVTTVSMCVFDGGHEWTSEFRNAAGEFLTRQLVDQSVE